MSYTEFCFFMIRAVTLAVFTAAAFVLSLEAVQIYFKFTKRPAFLAKLFRFKTLRILLHAAAAAIVITYVYACFIEPRWLEISRHRIETDKLENTSFRIVQITDTHCDKRAVLEQRLVREVRRLSPDAVVFTGDACNIGEYVAKQRFRELFSNIDPPLGIYGCEGNWSFDTRKLFEQAGIDPLFNESRTIEKNGETLQIYGADFQNPNIEGLTKLDEESFRLFLYHSPDLFEAVPQGSAELYLAGHTHGGQIALPFYGAIITFSRYGKKYEEGMFEKPGMQMYVSRGVGLDGGGVIKARFLARPELAVFDIVPKDE
ncbi:phosphodiesterase YaeI [Sedimentisphaera cyanobacteriorum]|uniref:Phosphodiesterase YaeI n=1 Tax=Sedimentisphaera cyanobacteriorum TaxID=1940790 RepID=A0A1Q2HS40_9BACT|nr:metallophosphoesterase [Sedimentisphaera cyanobacteriorum]AQQ10066.1 phosphodiesterase YaeI [Sedimentisphaera cyanobacteriorum]